MPYVLLMVVTDGVGWFGLSGLNHNMLVVDLLTQWMDRLEAARLSLRCMEWNFVNIPAIPLIPGHGLPLDFTIHMISALPP